MLFLLFIAYALLPNQADDGLMMIVSSFYLILAAGYFSRRLYQVVTVGATASLLSGLLLFALVNTQAVELRDVLVVGALVLFSVGSTFVFLQARTLRATREELKESNSELISAIGIKDRFLANMSHEIRTPLSGIIGATELLLNNHSANGQQQILRSLETSGHELLRIVDDILNISKLNENGYVFLEEPVNLKVLIEELTQMYSISAQKKDLEFTWHVGEIPELIIGDAGRIKQILGNLVSNAIKYTNSGSVSITARRAPSARDELVIRVSDTGVGISEEDRSRLFRVFEQLDSSYTKRHSGTGLGLAITRRLVETMNGRITVESVPGEGSTFSVSFPFVEPFLKAPCLEQPANIEREPAPRSAGEEKIMEVRMRVLLAEDDAVNALIMTRALESLGAEVCHAANGKEVLEKMLSFEPQLILMDAQMPEMSGVDATRHIRAAETDGRVPIVGLTAYSHPADIDALLSAGMDECFTKPIELEQLKAALLRYLPGLFKAAAG
jgi:signal transduction histidine kinase/ActR/RegA family two-component response regulator